MGNLFVKRNPYLSTTPFLSTWVRFQLIISISLELWVDCVCLCFLSFLSFLYFKTKNILAYTQILINRFVKTKAYHGPIVNGLENRCHLHRWNRTLRCVRFLSLNPMSTSSLMWSTFDRWHRQFSVRYFLQHSVELFTHVHAEPVKMTSKTTSHPNQHQAHFPV